MQRGVASTPVHRTLHACLRLKKLKTKAIKPRADANKGKSTSNKPYFTYLCHQSNIKHVLITTKPQEMQINNSKWNKSPSKPKNK